MTTALDLNTCLVGPLEQDVLDSVLQPELYQQAPGIVFFKESDSITELLQRHSDRQFQGILLIEPLRRLLPEDIWQINLPLIGLCSKSYLNPTVQSAVYEKLSGLIPLEEARLQDIKHSLAIASQSAWILGSQHQSRKDKPTLHSVLYVSSRGVSPWMDLYEQVSEQISLPIEYFIHAHPGRLSFHFQRAAVVLMDGPLSSLHLQAVACGARLLVHRQSPGIALLAGYLTLGQDFDYYDSETLLERIQKAIPDSQKTDACPDLSSLRLGQVIPAALAELSKHISLAHKDKDVLCEAIQLCGLNQPNALNRLRLRLDFLPPGHSRTLIEICFYMQLVASPYSQSDPSQIWAAIHARLQSMPKTTEVKLIVALAELTQGGTSHWQVALALFDELLETENVFRSCQNSAHWQVDPLYLELQQIFAENGSAEAILQHWLQYQRIMCLAYLQDFGQAREAVEALLRRSYFPQAASVWLALQAEVKPQEIVCELLLKHPQHLELANYWIRSLAESEPLQALQLCARYSDLSRRLLNKSHALEGFIALKQQLTNAAKTDSCYVLWEGPLFSYSSLASINRRWMQDLSHDPDFKISHIPFEPPELPKAQNLLALETLHDQPVDVFVTHHWPPREQAPTQGKWITIIPWEFGVIPQSWVHYLNHLVDQIWVPSAFVAQSFEISGVKRQQIEVIANGYDPEILSPEGETYPLSPQKGFYFLFVGGMLDRKGIDLLLEAYAQSFTDQDDVALVIKSFGSDSHYALNSFEQQIQSVRQQTNAPEIICIEDDLSATQIAALYRACHVYVHPYRGEGFGMPILEAMACGLPVIIPNAGPAPEFCPPEASWHLPTRIQFEESRDVQGLGMAIGPPYYTEVDLSKLSQSMRHAFQDRLLCQQKGQAAAEAAQTYRWQAIYPQVKSALQTQAQKPYAKRDQLQWRQQQISALPMLSLEQKQTLITQDPELISWVLPGLPAEAIKPAWRQALKAGLVMSSVLQLAKTTPRFWPGLPMRLHYLPAQSEASLCLPALASNPRMTLLPDNLHTDLSLSFGPNPLADLSWIWQNKLPQYLNSKQLICYSHPQHELDLLARGFAAEQLTYLPLAVDFEHFGPQNQPLVLEESLHRFVFLTIFDWRHGTQWQDLLRAYFASFTDADPVNLVFKAYGEAFEQMVESLMSWIESEGYDPESVPGLTFMQEELSFETLPGLYHGADCFVSTDAIDGIWYLAAQASGVPVISPDGHYPFLQRPFSEPYTDTDHLGWLMKAHWQQPEIGRGKVVRDYLKPRYHLAKWQEQAEDILMRAYLLNK